MVAALQALVEQVPDVVAVIEEIESTPTSAIARVQQLGTSSGGTEAEWVWFFVLALDADGLLRRMEYFDPEDESQARARFTELSRT